MANIRKESETERIKHNVLSSSTKLFLTKGYNNSSLKDISKLSDVPVSTLMYVFKSKEEILTELVKYALDSQVFIADELLKEKTNDPILCYAIETTIQLYMAESNENVRDLCVASYSLPKPSEVIHQNVSKKLSVLLKEYLPDYESNDFYELELASGGIIRNYMSIPCNMNFTMERKRQRYLESTLHIYKVPDYKIKDALNFIEQFDFKKIIKDINKEMGEFKC